MCVCVWSTGTLLCALPRLVDHKKGISNLCFSPAGPNGKAKYLAAVGQDQHHTVAIYYSASGEWIDDGIAHTPCHSLYLLLSQTVTQSDSHSLSQSLI